MPEQQNIRHELREGAGINLYLLNLTTAAEVFGGYFVAASAIFAVGLVVAAVILSV